MSTQTRKQGDVGRARDVIERTRPVVLVTRATGRLGGRVLGWLCARGRFEVRAMARRPDALAARRPATEDVEVVPGDLTDVNALRRAMAGCWAVTGYVHADDGNDACRQAFNLVDAAADAGVRRVVLGVIGGADSADAAVDVLMLETYARAARVEVSVLRFGAGGARAAAREMVDAVDMRTAAA